MAPSCTGEAIEASWLEAHIGSRARVRFLEPAEMQEVSGQLRRAQGKRRGKLLADDGEVVFFPLDGSAEVCLLAQETSVVASEALDGPSPTVASPAGSGVREHAPPDAEPKRGVDHTKEKALPPDPESADVSSLATSAGKMSKRSIKACRSTAGRAGGHRQEPERGTRQGRRREKEDEELEEEEEVAEQQARQGRSTAGRAGGRRQEPERNTKQGRRRAKEEEELEEKEAAEEQARRAVLLAPAEAGRKTKARDGDCLRCRGGPALRYAVVPIPSIFRGACPHGPFCDECATRFGRMTLPMCHCRALICGLEILQPKGSPRDAPACRGLPGSKGSIHEMEPEQLQSIET